MRMAHAVTRWRALRARARRWIVAGVVAGVGIVGAGVSAVLTDQVKDWTGRVIGLIPAYRCQYSTPQKPPHPSKPIILFAHLGSDPNDTVWNGVRVLLAGTELDLIPTCMRFEGSQTDSLDTAKENFVRAMNHQVEAIHADMLLFGFVYAPPSKVQIWTANLLGGCDQEVDRVDMSDATAPNQVQTITRSALLRAIIDGLVAACNRDQTLDWQNVARIVDVVAPYIEEKKSLLTTDDYNKAQERLFGLAYARYSHPNVEELWFDRAKHAADAMYASGYFPAEMYQGELGLLYYLKFGKTRSLDSLKQSVSYLQMVKRGSLPLWDSFLSTYGNMIVASLEAALSAGISGVTSEEIEQARVTSADLRIAAGSETIKQHADDARAYQDRGYAYEMKRDYDHAIADFSEAIRLDPSNADYLNDRCWARGLAGRDLSQALNDCDESLRLAPGSGTTLNNRALVQLKRGAFNRAITDSNAALKLDPKDANSLYGRGQAKLKNGDIAGGNADIANAKTIDPGIVAAYARYGVN
jgi:tetratricopeptide (TPR) repeat protein